MKTPLIALVLVGWLAGLCGFAQQDAPPPPSAPPPASAPVTNAPPATPPAQPMPDTEPPEAVLPDSGILPSQLAAKTGVPAFASGTNELIPLITVDEVPLPDAIRNLARQCNLNFQFDPKLFASNAPNVTLRFENVTAEEALEAVLENNNMQMIRDSKSRIARITAKVPAAQEPLYARIFQLKYSEPTNMVRLLKSALTTRSSVLGDQRTSQLIVTTTLKEMDSVSNLIERLDTPTKQVLIEAHILETSHTPTSVKGIDWSGTLANQNFRMGNNDLGSGLLPDGTPTAGNSASKLIADPLRGLTPHTAFLNADGLSAVLSFLNSDTDTETVATPRAVTLDNQLATLEVTRAFPIFQIQAGTANTAGGSQIQYTNLGVILKVTPRIAADKRISLHVVPEVSNIDGKDKQSGGSLGEQTANIYAIRRIETKVLIPSGNTLVMGGLINNDSTKAQTKVPLLGDIPGLGFFFHHEKKTANKRNLLIFVTPTIVDEDSFQATDRGTEFLKNRIVERPVVPETAWDSAKPHDWTKPVQ